MPQLLLITCISGVALIYFLSTDCAPFPPWWRKLPLPPRLAADLRMLFLPLPLWGPASCSIKIVSALFIAREQYIWASLSFLSHILSSNPYVFSYNNGLQFYSENIVIKFPRPWLWVQLAYFYHWLRQVPWEGGEKCPLKALALCSGLLIYWAVH